MEPTIETDTGASRLNTLSDSNSFMRSSGNATLRSSTAHFRTFVLCATTSRDRGVSRLVVAHKTKVRKWAVEDLNVAFPLERMRELEFEGAFKRLAHTAVSMVGSIQRFTELVEETIPAIKQIYDSQGVDLVFLFPFCPACHRATTVIARALEARGLPTLSMSVLFEAAEEAKPPRTCFLDFPLGCPAGKPHEAEQQREILRSALKLAPEFDGKPWHIKSMPYQWSPDGNRTWE